MRAARVLSGKPSPVSWAGAIFLAESQARNLHLKIDYVERNVSLRTFNSQLYQTPVTELLNL